ncbi:type IV secretion system DNA-binding domain-containing protein [Burkholderia pseudomallei]|uniref:type IV secretion system DNA-binding domain-containing protein n=1 Tax=Burkholderia pseudomallei TaxID=28450 RepID=UPI002468F231|nr:type IV secretion system DNA-binding domain-containing protein [Burkholderia pseudomallei]
MAITSLLSLPESLDRRIWFVLDELAALGQIELLQLGLQEGRKNGGCFVCAFQSNHQMTQVLGDVSSKIILELFATRVIYAPLSVETAKEDASLIGEYIEQRWNESESENNGGGGGSSGRSYSQQISGERPAVTATDLRRLKPGQGYLLAGFYPPAKIEIPLYGKLNKDRVPFFVQAPDQPRQAPPASKPSQPEVPPAAETPAKLQKPKKPRARKPVAKSKKATDQEHFEFMGGEEPPPGDPPHWLD